MPSSVKIANVQQALQQRLYPSVTTWNRLEGHPRTNNFDRALRAEVRDGLWMITKQWQMGEIRGSDAGSPVFAKLQIDTTRLTKYQPDSLPSPGLAKTKFAAYGFDVDSLICRGTKTQAGQRRRPDPFAESGQAACTPLVAHTEYWLGDLLAATRCGGITS
jgi:hypothetical protein